MYRLITGSKNKLTIFAFLVWAQLAMTQHRFVVDVRDIGPMIQPEMYGVFFEDINFGADGGLYAELIKNRSFEFHQPLTGWVPFGDVQIKDESPCFRKNPHYARFHEKGLRRGTGLENLGFTGIGYKKNNIYNFSIYARTQDSLAKKFRVELISAKNNIIGRGEVVVHSKEWEKYSVRIKADSTTAKGKIRLVLETPGVMDVDHVSMFPADTWLNRQNGLRRDIVEALYDLNPGVFRFPGGCIIEGNTLETRYQWKNSIGPVENRPINENRWNYTFKHRFYPDYYQTYGLGFYEYFLLAEDLGAEPLPVLSCGLACQYESKECVAVQDLDSYIQDALDLIEFANGSVTTTWGKVRSDMGHPEPFKLKMIGIGNEQWGMEYIERLIPFLEAIREKHPEIKIVGGSGPAPEGKDFDFLWEKMKELKVDLVDEHYYRSPEWFLNGAMRYDNYDRKGPKVFAGEYAAHHESRDNNMASALAEAAFMTGLERNADIVYMATYAPLLAHVDAWQWKPDMIWFDNLAMVRTPNYYVQQMFGQNSGTNLMSITENEEDITGKNGLYASAIYDSVTSTLIIKVVNASAEDKEIGIELDELKAPYRNDRVEVISLNCIDLQDFNTIERPDVIVPQRSFVTIDITGFKLIAQGNSFDVCKLKLLK